MYLLRKAARMLHGRLNFRGLDISVENRMGSIREWKDPHAGTEGMTRMKRPYGYICGTLGSDGDHYDCFIGQHPEAPEVYIVSQMKAPDFTQPDEEKALLAFESMDAARKFYLAHYDDSRFMGKITALPFEDFREKVMTTRDNGGKPIVKAIDRLAERVAAALRKSREVEGSGRYFSTDELRAAARRATKMNEIMEEMAQPMMTLFDKLVVDSDFNPFIREAGGDPSQIDMAEFRRGYKVEMEHKDVTGGDPVKTAKIVLAHLKENARYYSLLEKYVEKALPGIHLLRKSHIRSYQRRTAKGQTIRVQEHTNTVQKKTPQRREARQPRQENKTAENFVAQINKRFPNISINLTGATERTITPTLKQFSTLADRYPLAARSLSAITTLTEEYDVFPSQRPALIGVIGGKTVIALNPKFYGDEKHLFDHLDNERVKKELLPLISILYPITHEFGHLLYRQINTTNSNAAEKWATENGSKWHHTKVARANIKEAFAEGFSEAMLYQKTGLSRYAKGLTKFLEGYRGEK
jgi:hypothetical protein